MNNLTLVIPAKKEKDSLPQVLEELNKYEFKKIVVVDKSDIETIESIKKFECEIIFQDGKGYGDALIKGINNVKTEYFVIFNADGSFNPGEIIGMLNKTSKNSLDFLFASRYEKDAGSDDDTIITFIGNKIFTFLGNFLFKLNISDILYTFVIGSTLKAQKLNLKNKDFTFCVELPIKAKKSNYKIDKINSYERKRIAGKKKVNAFKDGLLILISMIRLYLD